MIPVTLAGTVDPAAAWLRRISVDLAPAVDAAVLAVLDETLRALVPVTPVRTGRMQADYTLAAGRDVWELIDTAESPKGYPYPGRVVFEPGFSHAYGALQQVLDHAEATLAADVEAALARLVGG